MVARGPGAVGCAHCKQIGAEVACQVCARLVCPRCEADWATCSEPSGRMLRLGMAARLRDVDPSGRLGVVWRFGKARLLDLRRLRWLSTVVPLDVQLGPHVGPCLTASDTLVFARYSYEDVDGQFFGAVYALDLAAQQKVVVADDRPVRASAAPAAGDRYVYVSDTETVVVVELRKPSALPASAGAVNLERSPVITTAQISRYHPLPYKVIQAVGLDAEQGRLASATWSEVVLHQLRGDRLELLGRGEPRGNVSFVAVAGGWLVAAARADGVTRLTAWALDASDRPGRIAELLWDPRPLAAASLSRDGRYLAASFGTEVVVHGLAAGTTTWFREHTDEVILVRFVGDEHLLVTADADNRVVLRPRAANGYAPALRPVTLPDEPVALEPRASVR